MSRRWDEMTDLRRALRAEWTKIRTVRSPGWTLAAALTVCVGLGYLVGTQFRRIDGDALFAVFYALTLGQLALVVFAVLAVGNEFGTGVFGVTLAAVPRRGLAFAAKAGTVGATAAVAGLVLVPAMVLAAEAGLGPRHTGAGLAQAAVGAWLYLTLICLFAAGVTMLVRSSAVALAILMPILFLDSQGLGNVPVIKAVTQFLPAEGGMVIMHLTGPAGDPRWARAYGPWTGLGVTALWAAAALAAGYLATFRARSAIRRRGT